LFWLFCKLVLRCVLQLVSLRSRPSTARPGSASVASELLADPQLVASRAIESLDRPAEGPDLTPRAVDPA
jgi:hypothetical protein